MFRRHGAKVILDATHQQMRVRIPIRRAQRLFRTKWQRYLMPGSLQPVALPARAPRLPERVTRRVDALAGLRVLLPSLAFAANDDGHRHARAAATGDPRQRTGIPDPGCLGPAGLASPSGLYPNQILTAYGIAPLQARGLRGQGERVAILGPGPAPRADLAGYRRWCGFSGTPLKMHGRASLAPNIESSLDTMVVSMVAPRLAGFDLWARQIFDHSDPAKVNLDLVSARDLLAAPLQAAVHGGKLPVVISVSFGTCDRTSAPTARRVGETTRGPDNGHLNGRSARMSVRWSRATVAPLSSPT